MISLRHEVIETNNFKPKYAFFQTGKTSFKNLRGNSSFDARPDSIIGTIEFEKSNESNTYRLDKTKKRYSDEILPIRVKRCFCTNKIGCTTIYYAIVPREYKPALCIANDTNNTVEKAVDIAKRNNATICINAGIFDMLSSETRGYTIVNGEVRNDSSFSNKSTTDYIYMSEDGSLQLFPVDESLEELIALKPQWAVLGFHPIVNDGAYVAGGRDRNDYSPRTFIGQDFEGNYILGACSGRMINEVGLSLNNIYRFVKAIGFEPRILYNLDGGGSSVFIYKGVRLNALTRGEDRACANFIIVKE